ncbi:hypothetical protein KKI24_06615 [bacterium]|nr:hypothetical protein [bacterium]
MWWKIVLAVLVGSAVLVTSLLIGAANRWQSNTKSMRARLDADRRPAAPEIVSVKELDTLPVPVQNYFRKVLTPGQPILTAVNIEHKGMFNMSESGENWKPFVSTQYVIANRRGFDWDAGIKIAPGLVAKVHDAYIAGEGILSVSLMGLIPIVEMRGTPEMAQGELMRFFAEAAWYPTALLPSQGVQWQSVNDSSARATLEDQNTKVTLLFNFNKYGLIESIRADARMRTVGNEMLATPWECYFDTYERHNGMLIPVRGEVAWMTPQGPKSYWKGRITRINHQYTSPLTAVN